MSCTFCRVMSGELPSSKILERDLVIAFLDIHPIGEGHTLIVPKRHVQSFTDLTPEERAAMFEAAQVVANKLKTTLSWCRGVTLSLADGVEAGQEVPHAHLHVIPRRAGDGFGWKFPDGYGRATKEALDAVAGVLRESR